MDAAIQARLDELNEEVRLGIADVDAAVDSEEEERQLRSFEAVQKLSQKYRDLVAEITDAKEREKVEWSLGRRVSDLRRAADKLTKRISGSKAEMARDAGTLPFLEQRQPPKSIVPQRGAPTGKLSVGSEIESWCGKCKEMREHHIVAMVGGEAKQVICVVCSSRHNYRAEPPAKARRSTSEGGAPAATTGARRGTSPEEREQQRRKELKLALQKELADAVEPRAFDPKGRYKAGEIIVHPEYGRGKIENVLRSSLLVRFLEGLRPLNLS